MAGRVVVGIPGISLVVARAEDRNQRLGETTGLEGGPPMTEMVRHHQRINSAALAAVFVAAILAAGVIGAIVGARLAGSVAAQAAHVAPARATVNWAAYGNEWQRQYEQQHPTVLDATMVRYGNEWQRQYEQQHPTVLDPVLVKYGVDWQRQYEQQDPPR